MNKGQIGIALIILGYLLNLAYNFFGKNETTPFGSFSSGLLLGMSIGIGLVGIILTVIHIAQSKAEK